MDLSLCWLAKPVILKILRALRTGIMAFFFYIPNLLVAEAFIKSQRKEMLVWLTALSVAGLLSMTALLFT